MFGCDEKRPAAADSPDLFVCSASANIDPAHARIQLLIACLQPDRQVHPYASSLVLKEMEAFREVFLNRSHYDHEVGEAGWGSEKEMCLNFDAATTRFFKSLT